jgi:hypothetical protein
MKKASIFISILVLFAGLIVSGCSSTMTSADKAGVDSHAGHSDAAHSDAAHPEMAQPAHPEMKLVPGQEVYACNCGAACDCNTLSNNPGKCTCGVDLAKVKVKSVGDGTAVLLFGGEERTFKTKGKYACACGEKCPCHTISQKPGKCTCGVEMIKVN